jgi:hypothetical protein
VTLDKQKVELAEYRSHLLPWRIAVADQYRGVWKQLLMRVIVVLSILGGRRLGEHRRGSQNVKINGRGLSGHKLKMKFHSEYFLRQVLRHLNEIDSGTP